MYLSKFAQTETPKPYPPIIVAVTQVPVLARKIKPKANTHK